MTDETVTIPKDLAYDALSLLASANALISERVGSRNHGREDTIRALEAELGVRVQVTSSPMMSETSMATGLEASQ